MLAHGIEGEHKNGWDISLVTDGDVNSSGLHISFLCYCSQAKEAPTTSGLSWSN